MSNPTHQEILEAQLARQWAEQVQQSDAEYERRGRRYSGDPMRAAAAYILANTTPPTMAEVEWDDDKHYLAEAETPELGKVVMLRKMDSGLIEFIMKPYTPLTKAVAWPEYFTPTGRRYTLTEVQE